MYYATRGNNLSLIIEISRVMWSTDRFHNFSTAKNSLGNCFIEHIVNYVKRKVAIRWIKRNCSKLLLWNGIMSGLYCIQTGSTFFLFRDYLITSLCIQSICLERETELLFGNN